MPSVSADLARPDFHTGPAWTSTLGDEVADLCDMVGYGPYPEQRLILDDVFALDGRRSASFETAVVACRQQMKTGLIKQCALGWLFITDQPLVIWSAHEFGTAQEAFRDMQTIIGGSDILSRRVARITTSAGNEVIELKSGARLKFKARTSGGGRGLTGSKVILDEAFALKPEHMGALLPTLISVDDPQVLYGSSAGLASSAVLRALRDRGRRGSDRLAYAEWMAPRRDCAEVTCSHVVGEVTGCALDDRDLWAQSCPVSFRRDPSLAAIAALRNAMPAEEFMRECMGWWDEPSGLSVIPVELWLELADREARIAGQPVFGLDVAPNQSMSAIGVAGMTSTDRPFVEVTGRGDVTDHRPGMEWVVPRVVELSRSWPSNFKVTVAAASAAMALVPALESRGITVDVLKGGEVAAACGAFYADAASRSLCHSGQPELTAAVSSARRDNDDGESAWRWHRRKSGADITPLYAVTLAKWASQRTGRSKYEDQDMVTV